MIAISYIYIAAILTIVWTIYRTIVLIRSEEKNILREVLINIFFVYFLILINLTICKMGMLQINFQNKFYVNYIPFIETINMFKNNFMGIGNAIYNVFGNILLFIPLGFFISLLFKRKNKLINIALYGFYASFTIEFIQLFTAINLTDIDDIIFNTLGAILGFLIYNLFNYAIKKTKISDLIRNVTSEFNGNLVVLSIKPLSVMFVSILLFTSLTIYNSTISDNTSNEEISKVVFKYSNNTDFEVVKDFSKYKLFLKDEDDYVNLVSIESVLNNRWLDSRTSIGQYEKSKGDYYISTIYDNIRDEENVSMSIVVFGKNKNANKININFNNKSYAEEIEPNKYFLVIFPSYEILKSSDIDNIYNGEESKILKVKFLDSEGNEYSEMKLSK